MHGFKYNTRITTNRIAIQYKNSILSQPYRYYLTKNMELLVLF